VVNTPPLGRGPARRGDFRTAARRRSPKRCGPSPGSPSAPQEGGNPIGDRPFIRGFDSQGSTFVDGVRDPAAQTREVFATDQVQIVRGSDSTLGGRGSAGGSINVISKLPSPAISSASRRASAPPTTSA
jgi:outer membrane receptor for monomeric catechols